MIKTKTHPNLKKVQKLWPNDTAVTEHYHTLVTELETARGLSNHFTDRFIHECAPLAAKAGFTLSDTLSMLVVIFDMIAEHGIVVPDRPQALYWVIYSVRAMLALVE